MKKIFFYHPDFANNEMFNPNVRDNLNEPFIRLKEKLEALGYTVKTIEEDKLDDCGWIFFMTAPVIVNYYGLEGKIRWIKHKIFGLNKNYRYLYQECIDTGLQDRMVFFLWEGRSVSPHNYDKYLLESFSKIFVWDDDYVDEKKFLKFYLPTPEKLNNKPIVNFVDKKLLVNISINKNSSYKKELYSSRKKSIKFFNDNFPNDFDLYGLGWNAPARKVEKIFPWLKVDYKCYKGPVKNKMDVLPYYKFSLCYENICGANGWVTEKIFDIMRAGVVPIYWGADNITDYVDGDAFLDRRKFKTERDLADRLVNMTELEYRKYLLAIDKYLNSDRFKLFLSENFANTVINKLKIKQA